MDFRRFRCLVRQRVVRGSGCLCVAQNPENRVSEQTSCTPTAGLLEGLYKGFAVACVDS